MVRPAVCHIGEVRLRIHHLRGLVDPRTGEERRNLRRLLERHDVLLVVGGRHHGSLALTVVGGGGTGAYRDVKLEFTLVNIATATFDDI